MKAAVDKLQCEVVDVVDKLERFRMGIATPSVTRNPPTCPAPTYRNPHDIPEFNHLETVVNVEVNHADPNNISVVSSDEFVPDILLHPSPGPPNDNALPLNYQSQTSQQI